LIHNSLRRKAILKKKTASKQNNDIGGSGVISVDVIMIPKRVWAALKSATAFIYAIS